MKRLELVVRLVLFAALFVMAELIAERWFCGAWLANAGFFCLGVAVVELLLDLPTNKDRWAAYVSCVLGLGVVGSLLINSGVQTCVDRHPESTPLKSGPPQPATKK